MDATSARVRDPAFVCRLAAKGSPRLAASRRVVFGVGFRRVAGKAPVRIPSLYPRALRPECVCGTESLLITSRDNELAFVAFASYELSLRA
jgi:hypothetical protein